MSIGSGEKPTQPTGLSLAERATRLLQKFSPILLKKEAVANPVPQEDKAEPTERRVPTFEPGPVVAHDAREVFGLSYTGHDAADRPYKRPSFEETQKLIAEIDKQIESLGLENFHVYINHILPRHMEAIAKKEIALEDIVKLNHMVIEIEKYRGELLKELRWKGRTPTKEEAFADISETWHNEVFHDENMDGVRLTIAKLLIDSIMLSEGLYGENEQGFVPDTSTSLANREQGVFGNVARVAGMLSQQQNLYGPQTRDIYSGITARLEEKRPLFNGVRLSVNPYPTLKPQIEPGEVRA